MYGHEGVVKWLWAKGAKMDAKTFTLLVQTRVTPLHIAAARGYDEIAAFLMASGVDPNAKDSEGVCLLLRCHQFITQLCMGTVMSFSVCLIMELMRI